MGEKELSFIEHLEELRVRLIKCILAWVVGTAAVYHFNGRILEFLARPVGKLVFLEPVEAFATSLRIALWGGFFAASPVIIYQVWRFIGTGLEPNERKWIKIHGPFSLLLFLLGLVFGVYLLLKFGIKFLLAFGSEAVTPMFSVSRYVSFVGNMGLAFGLVFQLPLLMLFAVKIGLVTPAVLARGWRAAVVLISVAAGLLTPGPDVFSQLAMAVPLLALFGLGLFLAYLFPKESPDAGT